MTDTQNINNNMKRINRNVSNRDLDALANLITGEDDDEEETNDFP